jgi:hypothetical protein
MLIASINPKWNPTVLNQDLCDELNLTDEEREQNCKPIEAEQEMTFDPNIVLSHVQDRFRIFETQESLHEISTKRYKMPGPERDPRRYSFVDRVQDKNRRRINGAPITESICRFGRSRASYEVAHISDELPRILEYENTCDELSSA